MKKIAIITNKFNSGGVEVSLLNLIEKLLKDRSDIDITLLVIEAKGVYLNEFKNKCKIQEIKFNTNIYNKCLGNSYIENKKQESVSNRIIFLFIKIFKKFNIKLFYKFLLLNSLPLEDVYDIVIDFHSYGYFGTCYGAKKIKSKNKILFIHDEKIDFLDSVLEWVKEYNKIFCVSKSCKNIVENKYSNLKSKLEIFHNIIPEEKIQEQSKEKSDIVFNKQYKNLLTIGRLEYQKGYDILIDIAIKLKKKGYKFKWYIIGNGSQKNYIEKLIDKNKLSNIVILLGMKKNPYPYLKQCDIYIQPSRHEGYGIAIAEARCLNKAIVGSRIKCIEEQIEDKVTGILCDINSEAFSKEIGFLLSDNLEIKRLEENLKKQKYKTKNDINKIYKLL